MAFSQLFPIDWFVIKLPLLTVTLKTGPEGVTISGDVYNSSPSLQAPLPPLGKAKLGSAGGSKKGLPPLKRALPPSPAAVAAAAQQIGNIPASSAAASTIPQQSLAVPERVGGRTSPGNLSREGSPEPQRKQWGDAKPLSLGMAGTQAMRPISRFHFAGLR